MYNIQGKKGTLCFYYNELFICGFPLGKLDLKDYVKGSEDLIVNSMRHSKKNIREQIFAYKFFCQTMFSRTLKKKNISNDDYRMFVACLLALVKLRIYEMDDVSLICGRKKKKKIIY
mgnify:CR=1 FL=1